MPSSPFQKEDTRNEWPVSGDVVLIKADTLTDLDKYKGKLKGKVVIFDTKPSPERTYKAEAARYTDDELLAMTKPAEQGQRRNFDRTALMKAYTSALQ